MQCVNIELVATRSAQLSFHTIMVQLSCVFCHALFVLFESQAWSIAIFLCKCFGWSFFNMLNNTSVKGDSLETFYITSF
jgi:hypothetical protein